MLVDFCLTVMNSSRLFFIITSGSMEYQMAIFADPIFYGRWPESVITGAGDALPSLDPSING